MENINIEMSSEIGSLAEALAKAQSVMKGAKEDASNPFYKSTYADLTSVWTACKESLSSNGLAIMQPTTMKDGVIFLVTMLLHSSGQWIKGFYPIMPVKNDPQALGSAITYARRYSLAALVGVCPAGDDDDAESAMDRPVEKSKPTVSKPVVAQKGLSKGQCAMLDGYFSEDKEAMQKIKDTLHIEQVYDMEPKDFDRTVEFLKRRKEQRENGQRTVA